MTVAAGCQRTRRTHTSSARSPSRSTLFFLTIEAVAVLIDFLLITVLVRFWLTLFFAFFTERLALIYSIVTPLVYGSAFVLLIVSNVLSELKNPLNALIYTIYRQIFLFAFVVVSDDVSTRGGRGATVAG